jgi:UDPglucose--hexose-1-phosphate uridylyltransferase
MTMLSRLMSYGLQAHLFDPVSIDHVMHTLAERLEIEPWSFVYQPCDEALDDLIKPILDWMVQKGMIVPDTIKNRDIYEAFLMDAMMPSPETVKRTFHTLLSNDSEKATTYLYQLSKASNYIKTKRLEKNIFWQTIGRYGTYELTINLAKPEKDPRDIEAASHNDLSVQDTSIPKCVICKENEQNMHNARMNLRIVPITLGSEPWHLQFSPYLYYDEHAIVLHDDHRPMKIGHQTIDYLCDFVAQFPHYFIGSNADLPIVGGSILNHDHFQGGRHTFPIQHAETVKNFVVDEAITITHLDWPMTVIRLMSKDRHMIKRYAIRIMDAWKTYDHLPLDIVSATNGISHHTVTPIVHLNDKTYVLDLVLRDNHRTDQYPQGVYHPHSDLWHIKKENIGLIEVMGLAILPGRLKTELSEIKSALNIGLETLDDHLAAHQLWFDDLRTRYQNITDHALQQEVGLIFEKVLMDAGVFKHDNDGLKALHTFIEEAIR